jgi:hypothetical protein
VVRYAKTVTFNGLVDPFPAFEAYTSAGVEPFGKKIFVHSIAKGKTIMNLFFAVNVPVSGDLFSITPVLQ